LHRVVIRSPLHIALSVLGTDRDGSVEVGERPIELAQLEVNRATIEVGPRRIFPDLDAVRVSDQGPLARTEPRQARRPTEMRPEILRADLDDLGEAGGRLTVEAPGGSVVSALQGFFGAAVIGKRMPETIDGRGGLDRAGAIEVALGLLFL